MEKQFFLRDNFIEEANTILQLPKDAVNDMKRAAFSIQNNDEAHKIAWNYYCTIAEAQDCKEDIVLDFNVLDTCLGEDGCLFSAVILTASLKNVLQYHKTRNIPLEISIETFLDLKLWMEDYYTKHNRWGLQEGQWLLFHFTGRLFRLDRMQFIHRGFNGRIKVYKNLVNNSIVVLSEPGIKYRGDGLIDGTNSIYDLENAWTSTLFFQGDYVEGNEILPSGKASNERVRLKLEEWRNVLSKGDYVLDMHIPAGSKLDHKLCGDSIKKSQEFFKTYFEEKEYAGYSCSTWLFDSAFEEILSPKANIVKFQREFYLYPFLGDDSQAIGRVFGGKVEDFSKAPQDNSMRRGIANYYLSGKRLQDGGGFILKEDLNWGSGKKV